VVIVDTTVWVDYFRGVVNPETDWVHAELEHQRLGLTDVILCEVLQGVRDDITAKDVEASVAFYRLLGVSFPEPEGPYIEATLRGGIRISINDAKMISEVYGGVESGGHGIGLAFLCDSPIHVDQLFADLTAKGYKAKLEPFDAFWGQRYATVLDPDGNPVDLFAPNSTSQNEAGDATN